MDYNGQVKLGDKVRITLDEGVIGNSSFSWFASIDVIDSIDKSKIGKNAMKAQYFHVCMKPDVGKVNVPEKWKRHYQKNLKKKE